MLGMSCASGRGFHWGRPAGSRGGRPAAGGCGGGEGVHVAWGDAVLGGRASAWKGRCCWREATERHQPGGSVQACGPRWRGRGGVSGAWGRA